MGSLPGTSGGEGAPGHLPARVGSNRGQTSPAMRGIGQNPGFAELTLTPTLLPPRRTGDRRRARLVHAHRTGPDVGWHEGFVMEPRGCCRPRGRTGTAEMAVAVPGDPAPVLVLFDRPLIRDVEKPTLRHGHRPVANPPRGLVDLEGAVATVAARRATSGLSRTLTTAARGPPSRRG